MTDKAQLKKAKIAFSQMKTLFATIESSFKETEQSLQAIMAKAQPLYKAKLLDVNKPYQGEVTFLHTAVGCGSLALVTALIELGANVNLPGQNMETSVHVGVKNCGKANGKAVLHFLLANGGDSAVTDSAGKTPVDYAPTDALKEWMSDKSNFEGDKAEAIHSLPQTDSQALAVLDAGGSDATAVSAAAVSGVASAGKFAEQGSREIKEQQQVAQASEGMGASSMMARMDAEQESLTKEWTSPWPERKDIVYTDAEVKAANKTRTELGYDTRDLFDAIFAELDPSGINLLPPARLKQKFQDMHGVEITMDLVTSVLNTKHGGKCTRENFLEVMEDLTVVCTRDRNFRWDFNGLDWDYTGFLSRSEARLMWSINRCFPQEAHFASYTENRPKARDYEWQDMRNELMSIPANHQYYLPPR